MNNAKLGTISLLPKPVTSANQSSKAVFIATTTPSVYNVGPGTISTLPTTNATSATSQAVRSVRKHFLAPVSPVTPSTTLLLTAVISVATEFPTAISVMSQTVFPVMLATMSRLLRSVTSAHHPWKAVVDVLTHRLVWNV